MDPTHATQPARPGEHLRATPELRWLDPLPVLQLGPVLQQKWISSDAARYEWRNVPLVEEFPKSTEPPRRRARRRV